MRRTLVDYTGARFCITCANGTDVANRVDGIRNRTR